MTYQAMKDCPTCEGDGCLPYDEDHAGLSPVAMYETPTCESCDGTGHGDDCPHCDKDGDVNGPDEPYKACEVCAGDGFLACPTCTRGYMPDSCGWCHEEIEAQHYFRVSCYVGDAELVCTDCAHEAYECPNCESEGRVKHESVKALGKVLPTVAGSCSCCGANPRAKGLAKGFDWYVYEARVVDVDGIYMARLCGDEHGRGCLSDTDLAREGEHEDAKIIADLLGDETDAAQTWIEDLQ